MNLLVDPVFRVRTSTGLGRYSLPELMALLGEDRVESLPGLQRHQEDAFHIFLCYLAGAVLSRIGVTDPKQDSDFWRDGIRQLTRQEGCADDSAWTLVVDDPTKPAFMQPPAPSREIFQRDYKVDSTSPDSFDVLQTARNHDIKRSRSISSDLEAWLFAIVSKQTMTGLLGKGNGGGMNRGIARMNSGYGSRPCVSWLSSYRSINERWRRDVGHLLRIREQLLSPPYQYSAEGTVLVWIVPWDGSTSLTLSTLDPFFIEVARRVRLRQGQDRLEMFTAGSAVTRIAAEELKGNLGDPWIPINKKNNGALTVLPTGLTPELMRDLIFCDGEYAPAAMQEAPHTAGSGWIIASVLVRGQGTTDGFHEVAIRIPERARSVLFGWGVHRDRLSKLSKLGLDVASTINYKALRPALFSLMEGGPESIILDKTEVAKWVDNATKPFSLNWKPHYFDWLWSTMEIPEDDDALRPWFERLRKLAHDTLNRAMERVPMRSGRSYRAKTRARSLFIGSLYKNFPQYMEVTHDQP
ncbi:MAG: type I-E CRISPR-associated protein Cse1/CasA [Deltaproteobacteria bacterium]